MAEGERSREEVLLKRGLKRSKLFLIQKITKNIRTLQNKKGSDQQIEKNERKIVRFNEELETLKELNVTHLTRLLVHRNDDTISDIMSSKQIPNEVTSRVYWRILQSKVMLQTCKALNYQWRSNDTHNELNEDSSNEEKKRQSNEECTSEKFEEQHRDLSLSSNTTLQTSSLTKHSMTSSMFIGSLSETSNNNMNSKTKDKPIKVTTVNKTKQKVTINSKRSTPPKITMETKRSKFTDNNTSRPTKKSFKQTMNRMGQRKRRQLWESKYGEKAKHLQVDKARSSKSKGKSHERAASDKEVIHPSWEASKRRKELEKAQNKFEGQHIVFSD